MEKILVTGGAGYIGSFTARKLRETGYKVVIVDNLSEGNSEPVKDFQLEKIDLVSEKDKLDNLFRREKFDGVLHFAAFIQMEESFRNPYKYFKNNLVGSMNLYETMVKNNCLKIVFSSSAGVYGNPVKLPIEEDDLKKPENPYGETKLINENFLKWFDKAHNLKSISLRYFNAAGGAFDGSIGEAHKNESHLIPLVIKSALENRKFTIFGGDYSTPDGTCIRDYIHVLDLADAHVLALKKLLSGDESNCFNVGNGIGYSNKQIVEEIQKRVNNFKWDIGPRRQGDADILVASIEKIKKELHWKPKFGLEEIILSALEWHKKNPQGYKK